MLQTNKASCAPQHAEHSVADDLSAFQRVYAVLRQPEVAIFLIMAVMFGYGMGTIDSFMFIYLRELGAGLPSWISMQSSWAWVYW